MINEQNQVQLPPLCFENKVQPYRSLDLVVTLNANLLSYHYCFDKELMEYLCFLEARDLIDWFHQLETYLVETLNVEKFFEFFYPYYSEHLMNHDAVCLLADKILEQTDSAAEVFLNYFPLQQSDDLTLIELKPFIE